MMDLLPVFARWYDCPQYWEQKIINYPLSLTLAVLAGFLWIILTEREELQQSRIEGNGRRIPDPFMAGIAALLFGLIVARLGYIFLHLEYFRLNPAETIYLWEGGLSGFSAGAGALLGLGFYSLRSRGSIWTLGDALAIPAQFVLFGSWTGCWFEGCAYGIPASIDPFVLGTDPFSSSIPRWPTQGLGVLLSLLSFALLTWIGERETPPGLRLALSVTAGAMSAATISLYRSDPVLLVGPARMDTWGYALLTLIGLVLMGNRLKASRLV